MKTFWLILFSVLAHFSYALEKIEKVIDEQKFVIVKVDLTKDHLKQYWKNDGNQEAYGSIESLKNVLNLKNQQLKFAVNSGIFAKEQTPLGLYIEEGKVLHPLNTVEPLNPKGNFSLMPNGVFLLEKNRAYVLPTKEYLKTKDRYRPLYATQSGPILLINNAYHPRFIEGSPSLKIRGGVCAKDEFVYFVVTETLINFYDFASFFKEHLQCQNALYLDGTLTQLYYEGRYYGAPFWKVREYVGIWGVTEESNHENNEP